MQHIIKRQILEFDVEDKLDVFTTQQEMDLFNKEMILPMLERIFNELSDGKKVLAIDRIEIDLGLFTIRDMKSIDPIALYERIFLQIQKLIGTGILSAKSVERNISKPTGVVAQWLFYMYHGYLPWNTISIDAAWYNEVLEAFAVEFESVTALRKLIMANDYARKRIIHQHHDTFLLHLIEILTAQKQTDLIQYRKELIEILRVADEVQNKSNAVPWNELNEKAWSLLFIGAAKKENNLISGQWATNVLRTLLKHKLTAIAVMNELKDQLKLTLPLIKEMSGDKKPLADQTLQEIKGKNKEVKHGTKKTRQRKMKQSSDEPQTNDLKLKLNDQEADISSMNEEDRNEMAQIENVISPPEKTIDVARPKLDEDGIFIVNAGIILLHPFLKYFFERLGFIHHKEFISVEIQQKALHLLHYLATENMTPEEHELTIAKILCAYDLELTMPKDIILNEAELAEADELMQAVISQWTILKNTSPAGLREGFLQRNGKLYKKNDNLYLQVEAASIDMLLDYLPWNLSIIKLPWMKETLRVEWR